MRIILASEADEASMNIRSQLLALDPWEPAGTYRGRGVLRQSGWTLVTVKEHHLYCDDLDVDLARVLGERPEVVAFASKHRSVSGTRSFTIHPIGNFGQAEFGGRPESLVPAAPALMTSALRLLAREAKGLPYTISFEATHHGPYLSTPSFYIEAGSDASAWEDPAAGGAIARTLLNLRPTEAPVVLGVGGGHYAPRITDVALSRRVSFGHIIPSYACESIGEGMLKQALGMTPGAQMVYFHRKALAKPTLHRLETWFTEHGLRVVREGDLEPIA